MEQQYEAPRAEVIELQHEVNIMSDKPDKNYDPNHDLGDI